MDIFREYIKIMIIFGIICGVTQSEFVGGALTILALILPIVALYVLIDLEI